MKGKKNLNYQGTLNDLWIYGVKNATGDVLYYIVCSEMANNKTQPVATFKEYYQAIQYCDRNA